MWGEPYRKSDRSVDVYVGKLRQKLDARRPRTALHPHPLRVRLPLRAPTRRSPLTSFTSFLQAGDSSDNRLAPAAVRESALHMNDLKEKTA